MKRESGGRRRGAKRDEKEAGEKERTEMGAALSQSTTAPQSSWDILIRERELIRIPRTAQAPESHL